MKHFKFINYPQGCLKKLKTVYFGSGSWALDSLAKAVLRQNATCLRDNPEADIIVEGHCDKKEFAGPDRNLGRKRAEAVVDYLVQLGVGKDRFKIKDRGESMPTDPGDSQDALAKNRRVELIPELEAGGCDGCEKCERDSEPDCNGEEIPEECYYCDKDDGCPDCEKEDDCSPDEVCDDCEDDGDCDNCDAEDDDTSCESECEPDCPNDSGPGCEEEDLCGLDEICEGCDEDGGCPGDGGGPPCGESGPPQPPPGCEFCEGEGPSFPGCGIMDIIPIPDCRGDESGTPDDGGGGQSA